MLPALREHLHSSEEALLLSSQKGEAGTGLGSNLCGVAQQ